MLLKELFNLSEGAVADKYEELKDTAKKCVPYIFIAARAAAGDEINTHLRSVNIANIGKSMLVRKGDFIARIMQTGSIKNPKPLDETFVLSKNNFSLFTEMSDSKPDIEGFIKYEGKGEPVDCVEDGSHFIIKVDKNITQLPAALFNKEFIISK